MHDDTLGFLPSLYYRLIPEYRVPNTEYRILPVPSSHPHGTPIVYSWPSTLYSVRSTIDSPTVDSPPLIIYSLQIHRLQSAICSLQSADCSVDAPLSHRDTTHQIPTISYCQGEIFVCSRSVLHFTQDKIASPRGRISENDVASNGGTLGIGIWLGCLPCRDHIVIISLNSILRLVGLSVALCI